MDKKIYNEILNRFITNKKRKKHSVSTAQFMEKHAHLFGLDPEKSYIAGLLHDIGKYIAPDEILELAASYNKRGLERIGYLEFKKERPFLLHGVASAEILIRKNIITDIDCILAITHHTTGGTLISKLAKYTFICDFCEPERKYNESKKVRNILIKKNKFDQAYYYSYYYLIEGLIERKMEICIESIDGYNEALGLIKNNSQDSD